MLVGLVGGLVRGVVGGWLGGKLVGWVGSKLPHTWLNTRSDIASSFADLVKR